MKRLLLACLFLALPAMAHAASCSSYPFTLQNNTTADATQVMADFNLVRNCVINNAAGSGVNTDITSLTGLTTPLSVPQGGTPVFIGGTSTGSANAQVVASAVPIGYTLTAGYRISFVAGFTNTSTVTLNTNSTGATAIKKLGFSGLEVLTGNEIHAGNVVEAIYDGTQYVLLTSHPADFGTATAIASATTTDLGSIPSHNASITGVVAITGFGSTAVVTAPLYYISFTGALTLTYNATSLIIPGAANITTANGDTAVVEYMGSGNWRVRQYTRVSGQPTVKSTPLCGAIGLVITNNSGTPSTQIDVTVDRLVTVDPTTGNSQARSSQSFTINLTTTDVINGSDGARPTNNWTYIYALDNGSAAGAYASSNAVGAFSTTPTGYSYQCRLGAMRLDGSQNLYRTRQAGNVNQWKVTAATNTASLPVVKSDVDGSNCTTATPTYAAEAVRGATAMAPSTASAVQIFAVNAYNAGANARTLVAPNGDYGGAGSATSVNIPPGGTMQVEAWAPFWMVLESSNIYYCGSGAGSAVLGFAYRDAVNAN